MALSHDIIRMGGGFTIVWQDISKHIILISEKTQEQIKEAIWEGFKCGVEAERDRLYKIMGKWPPYDIPRQEMKD